MGNLNRYKVRMKIHLAQLDTSLSMLFKETVKEAKPSGEFTVLTQFESASANAGGMEQDLLPLLPTITVMRDKAGKISAKTEGGLEQISSQITPMFQGLSTMQDSYVPKNPVKVGDKWKVTATTPSPTGGETKSEGEATLVGTEIVGGIKSLKVKVL